MKRNHTLRLAGLLALAQSLAACGNPYALKLSSANYEAAPMAGEITITDPKLYRREALINERREERTYINNLITASADATKVKFQPEIVRQLEVVKMLALSLGVGFDPAAGKDYQRKDEKADIQQEMDVLKLQMQLDQLKRDVELRREALAKQTVPSADSGGAAGGSGSAGSGGDSGTNDPPKTDAELAKAIGLLETTLKALLADKFAGLAPADVANLTNPIDEFNDRATYRELLNSARNANSLDELHDYAGSSLVRLNLTATVFPPMRGYRDSFGQLKMQVVPPEKPEAKDREAYVDLYRKWLAQINQSIARPLYDKGGKDVTSYELSAVGNSLSQNPGLLEIVWYEFSRQPGKGCRGLAYTAVGTMPTGCMIMPVAIPPVISSIKGGVSTINQLAVQFNGNMGNLDQRFDKLADSATILTMYGDSCTLATRAAAARWVDDRSSPASGTATLDLISLAQGVSLLRELAPAIEMQVQLVAARDGIGPIDAKTNYQIERAVRAEAARVIAQMNSSDCGKKTLAGSYVVDLPQPFLDVLKPGNARLYQIGPKQQVQIVSTQARAAEAFALAAAVSAKQPASGLGLSAGANYSRSAVGRADALERVPLVVGFGDVTASSAEEDKKVPSFGWMMGPRAVLDPAKQRLLLEQGLKPQDLSIDLIVPGWWPYLDLKVQSTWSPNWQGRGGKSGGNSGTKREVRVNLSPSASDYAHITGTLLGIGDVKQAQIDRLVPNRIKVCATGLSLQIHGPQVWRAESVIVGGREFMGDQVKVLPDLDGVVVAIATADFPVVEDDSRSGKGHFVSVSALTPYGEAAGPLALDMDGLPKAGCTPAAAKPPVDGSSK